MAVIHVYLIPGTLARVPDGWCATCQASSLWSGPVWRLAPGGISLHGEVTGCDACKDWTTVPADPG